MERVQQSFNLKLYCLRGITIGAGIESDVGGASAYDKQMKLIAQPSHWVSANYSVISVIM